MRIYPNITQDAEYLRLGDQGFTGSLNDRQFLFLRSLGYTGSLSDMMYEYKKFPIMDELLGTASAGFIGSVNPLNLWQDSSRTTRVTTDSDPVGSWKLLTSTGAIYATQSTAGNRPVFKTSGGLNWLEFDGATSNRFLTTPTINFTTTDAMTVVVGLRKLSDAAAASVIQLGVATDGAFEILAPGGTPATQRYVWRARGTGAVGVDEITADAAYTAPVTNVITGLADISADIRQLRVNGTLITPTGSDMGTGNFINAAITIGRRAAATLPMNARLHSLIVRGALTSSSPLEQTERWVNQRTGAY